MKQLHNCCIYWKVYPTDPIGGIGFLCERLVGVLSYKIGPKNGHVGIPSQLLIDMQDDVVQKVMQDVIFHVLAERVVVEYVGFAVQGVQGPHSLPLFPTLVVFLGGVGRDRSREPWSDGVSGSTYRGGDGGTEFDGVADEGGTEGEEEASVQVF